jgi:glycosyltransferase involved in cell wall biosynthesis
MRILWFSWKDLHHPLAGGAERVGHDWRRRLALEGQIVRHLTAGYEGASAREWIDGVDTVRCGRSALSHYPAALARFVRDFRTETDLIVEEVNTVPYGSRLVAGRVPVVLFYHQLAREIWFHQAPQPIALAGYLAEAGYTWLLARGGPNTITVSADSRRDLMRFGFQGDRIRVIANGIGNSPLATFAAAAKAQTFTVLFHGSLRAMKQPQHALQAFHGFLSSGGHGDLWISGAGPDASLRAYVDAHGLSRRVRFFGRTSDAQKLELMQQASVLVVTSIKEGWGLVVTEANSMATPAVVYDVDGLRSAAGTTNWRSTPTPEALSARLHEAAREFANRPVYDSWCMQVLEASRAHTQDASYRAFRSALLGSAAAPRS